MPVPILPLVLGVVWLFVCKKTNFNSFFFFLKWFRSLFTFMKMDFLFNHYQNRFCFLD